MSQSEALHAAGGFTVEVSSADDDSGYSEIAEVVDAQPPEWIVRAAKATHNASPNNMTESKPGIGETSAGMLTLNFTADQFSDFQDLFRQIRYWKFNLPLDEGEATPANIKVRAYWSKLGGIKLDPEDANVILATVELTRASGQPTFTEGS